MKKAIVPILALLLLAVGAVGRYGPEYGGRILPPIVVGPQPIAAIVVCESGNIPALPAAQLVAYNSPAADKYLASINCPRVLKVDPQQKAPKGKQLPDTVVAAIKEAEGKPQPHLIITSKSGKVLFSGPFSTDKDAWLSLLQKYGGKP